MLLPAQKLMDPFAQRAGPLAVDHPDRIEMGQDGIVQIFVQLRDGLIHRPSQQVDLRADGEGLAHLDPSAAGMLFPGSGKWILLLNDLQI